MLPQPCWVVLLKHKHNRCQAVLPASTVTVDVAAITVTTVTVGRSRTRSIIAGTNDTVTAVDG